MIISNKQNWNIIMGDSPPIRDQLGYLTVGCFLGWLVAEEGLQADLLLEMPVHPLVPELMEKGVAQGLEGGEPA
jgi:hypothetical protein